MRKMKDSGIPWIGKIPENWSTTKIKHHFDIIAGATPKSEQPKYWDGQISWITPADYKTQDKYVSHGRKYLTKEGYDSCGTTIVPANSIIFSKRAPVGTVAITANELCTNQGCLSCVIRNNQDTDAVYYYYAMSSFTEQFELVSTGTTFKEIAADVFANFFLPRPPYSIQRNIAVFLDFECAQIDAVMEQTRASIEEYKKLKQSIITEAVTKGIRQNRDMKPCHAEWIDNIPTNWIECRIKDVVFPQNRPVIDGDKIITCFRDGTVTLRKNRREDGFTVSFTENGYQGVECGDLVIHGMDAFAGAIGCSDSRGKTTPVVHVCKTAGNNKYFMYFLRSMAYGDILMDLSNGVRIRSSDFRNFAKLGVFRIVVPPIEEQNAIVKYLDEKVASIDYLIREKERLMVEMESYKKSLIFEYVTGKKEA